MASYEFLSFDEVRAEKSTPRWGGIKSGIGEQAVTRRFPGRTLRLLERV